MRAIGFHGTSVEAAQRILSSGFQVSRNEYDWLGDGVYFFQDAPARALEWARKRFGDQAAVIGAEIDLTDGIDLLDVRWHAAVGDAYARYRAVLVRQGTPLPRQTRGAHRRDRAVLNYLAARLEAAGQPVKSVRTAFAEGEPLFPESALLDRSHVQIAVRDPSAILRIWRVE
jgi:nucleotide-binding universal stress UspA family protein